MRAPSRSAPLGRRFASWLISLAALAAASTLAAPGAALAWGSTGHRMIGQLAVETLPDTLPAFLRSSDAAFFVGEASREPDRWRDSGKVHDTDHDPAHFVDEDDSGKVLGGPSLDALPPTRAAYETALRAVGADSWKAGYLPYSIAEGYQQLVKDMTYWRMETAALDFVTDPGHRAWLAADRKAREALILRDLGVLGHFVGDGSQPLHVTVHFNGWGPFANPKGYTTARIHVPFEGPFVFIHVSKAAVRAQMSPLAPPAAPIEAWTAAYLAHAHDEVIPLYELYKSGGFSADPDKGAAFAAARLAEGASALRDLTVGAWRDSADGAVGYPALRLSEVVDRKIDPYDVLFGLD
ncbi:MAG: S1/P1 Nuclease [Alphaproteobacteria bacterium]|nr:S1/P1 Nuclease [Alphaproteobacteria bacterium]